MQFSLNCSSGIMAVLTPNTMAFLDRILKRAAVYCNHQPSPFYYPFNAMVVWVLSKKLGYIPLELFFINSGLRKFSHCMSIVEMCYQLSSSKVDAESVINLTVVGRRQCLRNGRQLVYHSDRQALSTPQFCRAGLLATADACWLHD